MSRSRAQVGLLVAASSVLWFGVGCAATLLWLRREPVPVEDGSEITAALEALDLTEDQRREVARIVADYRRQVVTLHADVEQARSEFWNEVRRAEADADDAIARLLTDRQRESYEEMALGDT